MVANFLQGVVSRLVRTAGTMRVPGFKAPDKLLIDHKPPPLKFNGPVPGYAQMTRVSFDGHRGTGLSAPSDQSPLRQVTEEGGANDDDDPLVIYCIGIPQNVRTVVPGTVSVVVHNRVIERAVTTTVVTTTEDNAPEAREEKIVLDADEGARFDVTEYDRSLLSHDATTRLSADLETEDIGAVCDVEDDLPATMIRSGDQVEILGQISKGGMAKIYVGRIRDQTVAVKMVRDTQGNDLDGCKRALLKEASVYSRIGPHDHIVKFHGFVEVNGEIGIALEYVDGLNLNDILKIIPDHKLNPFLALKFAKAIASVLVAGHKVGVINRDLTLHNVMLTLLGEIKCFDFGIAETDVQFPYRDPRMAGKPSWTNPEVLKKEGLQKKSDLFHLAMNLYYLMAGKVSDDQLAKEYAEKSKIYFRCLTLSKVRKLLVQDPLKILEVLFDQPYRDRLRNSLSQFTLPFREFFISLSSVNPEKRPEFETIPDKLGELSERLDSLFPDVPKDEKNPSVFAVTFLSAASDANRDVFTALADKGESEQGLFAATLDDLIKLKPQTLLELAKLLDQQGQLLKLLQGMLNPENYARLLAIVDGAEKNDVAESADSAAGEVSAGHSANSDADQEGSNPSAALEEDSDNSSPRVGRPAESSSARSTESQIRRARSGPSPLAPVAGIAAVFALGCIGALSAGGIQLFGFLSKGQNSDPVSVPTAAMASSAATSIASSDNSVSQVSVEPADSNLTVTFPAPLSETSSWTDKHTSTVTLTVDPAPAANSNNLASADKIGQEAEPKSAGKNTEASGANDGGTKQNDQHPTPKTGTAKKVAKEKEIDVVHYSRTMRVYLFNKDGTPVLDGNQDQVSIFTNTPGQKRALLPGNYDIKERNGTLVKSIPID